MHSTALIRLQRPGEQEVCSLHLWPLALEMLYNIFTWMLRPVSKMGMFTANISVSAPWLRCSHWLREAYERLDGPHPCSVALLELRASGAAHDLCPDAGHVESSP